MGVTIHAVKKHKKEAYNYIRDELGADLILLFILAKTPPPAGLIQI